MGTIFGRILHSGHVEDAIRAHLQTWLPTYLAEIERQQDPPITPRSLPMIPNQGWHLGADTVEDALDQIGATPPYIIIRVPGFAEEPRYQGDDTYEATWDAFVTAVVETKDDDSARKTARMYTAAARAVIVQKPDLGGEAIYSRWVDEQAEPLGERDRRMGATTAQFHVTFPDVQTGPGGPDTPDDPYTDPGDGPVVASVTTTVEPVSEVAQ